MDRRHSIESHLKMKHDKSIEILYEDRWLIAIDKPCGLLSMSAGRENEVTAYSLVTGHVGDRIFIVHRLDRDTSGVLLFAKDYETKRMLQDNWGDNVTERRYHAVLEGDIDDEEGWIETWLYENPKSMKVHCYPFEKGQDSSRPPRKDWQFASSHCRRVGKRMIEGKAYTDVEFNLETGRKNQIRVHSQWIGHPVTGDRKYGAAHNPFSRLALHALSISFTHPRTGKFIRLSSQLPKVFRKGL